MAKPRSRSIKPKEPKAKANAKSEVRGKENLKEKILAMIDEGIAAGRHVELTEDDEPFLDGVDVDGPVDEFAVAETQEDLEFLYGKAGPPEGCSILAQPEPPRVVDLLGRPLKSNLNDPAPSIDTSKLPSIPDILAMKKKKQNGVTKISEAGEGKKHRVSLMRDHHLVYPDLFLDVFVAGPAWEEAQFAGMLARARCQKAKSVLEADLVIFTGGVDVDPALYGCGGDKRHPKTDRTDEKRDDEDINLYLMCLEEGIPMLGICRGAQFLHVMNGGSLYQHVDNHYGPHSMWDVNRKIRIEKVSSVHHQMVIPNIKGGMEIIATSNMAKNRWRDPKTNDSGTIADIEAFFYRDTCCIGIQGHPEYAGYNHFTKWALDLINELVCSNPDTDTEKGNRRLKADFLAQRETKLKQEIIDGRNKLSPGM